MPTAQRQPAKNAANGGKTRLNVNAWPTERWVAIITLAALLLLIAIRQGFRGVNILGIRTNVS